MSKMIKMIVLSSILAILVVAYTNISTTQGESMVMADDALTIRLSYQRISPGHYLLLYNSAPHLIDHGHIALTIGCDNEVEIVAGFIPDLNKIESRKVYDNGHQCIYEANIENVMAIALFNPSEKFVRLPSEATVTIHVMHAIESGEHGEHEH